MSRSAAKVKVGDGLLVKVDPRQNNGSDEALAFVTRDVSVEDDTRVNLRVLLDGEETLLLRSVPVLSKKPDADDEDAPKVYAVRS